MPLYLDTGHQSAQGARRDEDACLIVVPESEHEITAHGAMLAVAEAVRQPRDADPVTRDALKALGDAFYSTPENWGLKHALQESLAAANAALYRPNVDAGPVVALTAVAVRRRRWALIHVGHTRAWLLRDNELKLLTRDHIEPRMQAGPRVIKAVGLSAQIDAQFISGELRDNDIFVLATPGVHNVLEAQQILSCLVADVPARQMASTILDRAGRPQVATACVVRIEQLPEESQLDIEEGIAVLPAMAPPDVGDVIDGFRVERLVHKSSRYRLYKATDTPTGQVVALKFPNPRDADDPSFAERFLREEWVGRRVSSAYLLRTLALRKGRRTALYSVLAYPSGESLARKLGRKGKLGVRESVFIGTQLLEALNELHNQNIVHNDVRPQNMVLEKNAGHLLLLGLGSSHVTQTSGTGRDPMPEARRNSFVAPELFEPSTAPTIRSDSYAAGVTIYRMLTGSYPYGKIAPTDPAPSGEYIPMSSHRQDISEELDAVIQRACALDPKERYDTAHDFANALEGTLLAVNVAKPAPVVTAARPRLNWEIAAIGAAVVALLAYLAFVLRR